MRLNYFEVSIYLVYPANPREPNLLVPALHPLRAWVNTTIWILTAPNRTEACWRCGKVVGLYAGGAIVEIWSKGSVYGEVISTTGLFTGQYLLHEAISKDINTPSPLAQFILNSP